MIDYLCFSPFSPSSFQIMSNLQHHRPIINEQRPNSAKEDFRQNQSRPALWSNLLRKMWHNYNSRYMLLWLSVGALFTFAFKPAIQQREKALVYDELDEYLKRKKDSHNT